MRDRFTITVTEVTGSHHYEFHVVTKQVVHYALVAGTALIIIAFALIVFLQKNVTDLEMRKNHIFNRLSFLQEENGTLSNDIKDRIREFDDLYEKIANVEHLVGLDSNPELSLSERMETARLLIAQREQEFQEIADKVQNIEGLIGLDPREEEGTSLLERLDLANLTATQKRAMLDNIPSGFPVSLAGGGMSSGFGSRTHPTLKRPEFHTGADIRARMRTPVKATADGVVHMTGNLKNKTGYGIMVIVNHNFGFGTAYAHLHEPLVKPGDFVKKGDVIALSGNSGLSSGPHVHYEVRFLDQIVDPVPFLNWSMENYEVVFKEHRVKWPSLVNLINHRLTNLTPQSLQLAQK